MTITMVHAQSCWSHQILLYDYCVLCHHIDMTAAYKSGSSERGVHCVAVDRVQPLSAYNGRGRVQAVKVMNLHTWRLA